MADQDWQEFRTLLRTLWNDPNARKRIEQRADIAQRTLTRWISGETEEPDRKRLYRLLDALPEHRDVLLAAITRAMPDFDPPLIDSVAQLLEDLPMSFLLRLLEVNATSPRNLHFAAVVNLIFLQLQAAIDPERLGIKLTIAGCSPPASPDYPVRSLREVLNMKTYQSLLTGPADTLFLGAESLSGYSVSVCQPCIVQDTEEEQLVPVRRIVGERSAAVYPIQRGGHVAGVFLVSSSQVEFFTQQMQYLLQVYTYLLGLAFETESFYAPERLRLRPMPTEQIQRKYIASFRKRVISMQQCDPSLSRLQAETAAWQHIEEDLLVLSQSIDQERGS